MKGIKLNFVIALMLFSCSLLAQTEAVTKDGKKVLLYKNGTWKYVKTENKNSRKVNDNLKNEANAFALQLVRSYFAGNCAVMDSSLSSEIFTFKTTVKLNDQIRSEICRSVRTSIKDSSKTFKDYCEVYKLELLSKEEIESKVKTKLPSHFNATEAEFYFLGFEPKASSSASFIYDPLFTLLIRKTGNKWEVKGFLSD